MSCGSRWAGDETITLFRPVGQGELELINKSGNESFPPRFFDQPIFYPILSEEYAVHIARDWNAKYNDPKRGYVTRFHVKQSFLDRYAVHIVGGSLHQEYWIPAEDLDEFNHNIVGPIEVIAEFTG